MVRMGLLIIYFNVAGFVGCDIVKLWFLFFMIIQPGLITKKQMVRFFSDLRLISFCNFINKVISRVLHDRLEGLPTTIISQNQSLFVKGTNITENVLLA